MERTDTRTRSRDTSTDIDELLDDGPTSDTAEPQEQTRSGVRGRLKGRAASVFSPTRFLTALVLSVSLYFVAGAILPFGSIGSLVGVLLAGFALGLAGGRQYTEIAVAGGVTAGVAAVVGNLVLTLVGVGLPVVALGVGGGIAAAVGGHYFGRDLRHGLTRDL
jgi:hypothetical protein